MGYGRDVSRYNDGKRVVKDKDIGPLVSTDMTRCIHCTRCVRFGEEITGQPQLGTTERGENMKIGTYIEQSVDHELSANIIDLCPVGALNNKPYRYSARAWEMVQHATVAPHDCVGSNIYAHVLRGTVKRIVPRPNEAINETWISDRDRFSYEAVYSDDRLLRPRLKDSGEWREVDWDDALAAAADALRAADAGKTGIIATPAVTVEEGHLLAQLADHLDTANLDHRTGRRDIADQDNDPIYPSLGCRIAELEGMDAILVAGCNVRAEAPIIAHRLRKAALAGAKVSFANSVDYEYFFDVADYVSGKGLVELLAGIAVAAAHGSDLPDAVADLCEGVAASAADKRIAASLKEADDAIVLLGTLAGRHSAYTAVRALSAAVAELTGARFGGLTEGPNTAGAHLAGVLPHRTQGGENRESTGLGVADILTTPMDAVVLVNVEPDADVRVSEDAVAELSAQKNVIALTPFVSDLLLESADVLLPTGTFAETSGTYVNVEGEWQSFGGVANPVGEARPTWKVLRVLGNLVEAPGFDYVTSEDVRDEFVAQLGEVRTSNDYEGSSRIAKPNGEDSPQDEIDVPLYSVDSVVRRARALQLTDAARRAEGEG